VQASQSRAGALLGGYPNTRDALFVYDVVVLANVDPDLLTTQQLALTRAFVAERGAACSCSARGAFQRQGLRDTTMEDVLPLELADRSGAVVDAAASPGRNRVALTPSARTIRSCSWAANPPRMRSAGPRSRRWRPCRRSAAPVLARPCSP
jgi:hypothetical protein